MSYRQVIQGEPVEGGSSVRFNGEGGVRREWWWEAGPVDSCCFCCSLRAGVAILATTDLLYKGIWTTFYLRPQVERVAHFALAEYTAAYDQQCSTGRVVPQQQHDCLELEKAIEVVQSEIEVFDHLPTVFYIQGVIAIVAGIAGLVAVFNSNALAAKAYLWTWLPRFLAMVATEWATYAKANEAGLDQNPAVIVFTEFVHLIFIVYYVKVLWSYHKRLDGSSNVSSPPRAAEGTQLRNGLDGV